MTTVAWDGKTLAADGCSWSGGVRRRVRKVFKIRHSERGELLVAFAGQQAFCVLVLEWLRGKGEQPDPAQFYERDDFDKQCAVIIDKHRRVWSLSNTLVWCEMLEPIFANGAGQEFAWGALEAGADAVRAVEIAIKRSDYAGLAVDSVSFE